MTPTDRYYCEICERDIPLRRVYRWPNLRQWSSGPKGQRTQEFFHNGPGRLWDAFHKTKGHLCGPVTRITECH